MRLDQLADRSPKSGTAVRSAHRNPAPYPAPLNDGSLIEEVDAGPYAASGRQVDGVDAYFRVAERHSCSDFTTPATTGWSARRTGLVGGLAGEPREVGVVVEGVGEVEAERSAAPDADVGHEAGFGALGAVDVDDRRSLTGARRRVTAHDYVTYRHLANHTRTIVPIYTAKFTQIGLQSRRRSKNC